MKVYGASSTIQLVSPLTKEQVALDNGGGGNWGAGHGADIHQIKTISPSSSSSNITKVSCCGVSCYWFSLLLVLVVVLVGGDGGGGGGGDGVVVVLAFLLFTC